MPHTLRAGRSLYSKTHPRTTRLTAETHTSVLFPSTYKRAGAKVSVSLPQVPLRQSADISKTPSKRDFDGNNANKWCTALHSRRSCAYDPPHAREARAGLLVRCKSCRRVLCLEITKLLPDLLPLALALEERRMARVMGLCRWLMERVLNAHCCLLHCLVWAIRRLAVQPLRRTSLVRLSNGSRATMLLLCPQMGPS